MNTLSALTFCRLLGHKWVGPHYHRPDDIIRCDGECWCEWCGFLR